MLRSSSLFDRSARSICRQKSILNAALQPLEQRLLLSTVSIANATGNEGSPLTFNLSLDAASASPITVNYATSNKTAKAGHDFTTAKGTVTFAAGQTTQTVAVNTIDNHVFGPALTMNLALSKPTKGVKLSPSKAVGTINNIDAAPVVTVTSPAPIAAFAKGKKTITFTINEAGTSTSKVSVPYSTQDLSAVAGVDYVAAHGTAKFSGKKTSFAVKVKINAEPNLASDKDFLLQLSSPTNATLGTPSYGVGVIGTTGTAANAGLSVASAVTAVPGSNAGVTVSLNQIAADPITVHYTTSGGTAGAGTDYTTSSGTLTFPVGTTTQTIDVPILDGATAGNTFNVVLSSPTGGASISSGTSTVTISNAASVPSLSVADISVNEATSGSVTADLTVTLSAASSEPVMVSYATADGTAVAGTNYTAATGTLTFPAGTTTEPISVTVLGGVASAAGFVVNLNTPVNATISNGSATVTIENPSSSQPSLSIADLSQDEGVGANSTFDFVVTLSAPSTNIVAVNYATADGTATVANNDYQATSGTLTFPAGATSETIPVTVIGNTTVGPNLTFTVNLTAPSNAALAKASATGTIINNNTTNPSTPAITINDAPVAQATGGSTAAFVASLTKASTQPVTFNYQTADGTAIAGTNYTSTSGTVTFAPGQTSQTIDVPILDDTALTAPDATFTLTLSAPSNATLNNTTATGTIYNNNGIVFDPSTGFASTNTHGTTLYTAFNYSVTSSRADSLPDLQIQFFVNNQGQDVSTLTPFQTTDLGALAAGQTISGTVDLTNAPQLSAGQQYTARLISNTGTIIVVYYINTSAPVFNNG